MKTRHLSILLMAIVFLTGILIPGMSAADTRADAVVLVNSTSPNYADFQHYIKPYLSHFGIPYTVLDIASGDVPANIDDYAVIIIGHRQLDTSGSYLDSGYVEDRNEPGNGVDKFWIQVRKDSSVIGAMSMVPEATGEAVLIQGSNIAVPHR